MPFFFVVVITSVLLLFCNYAMWSLMHGFVIVLAFSVFPNLVTFDFQVGPIVLFMYLFFFKNLLYR